MSGLKLFYDGSCYFCRNFALVSKLKSQARVELIDLREHPNIQRAFLAEGVDIDSSFVVEANGQRLLENAAMSYLLVQLGYRRMARAVQNLSYSTSHLFVFRAKKAL